jgi:hypothetical protein
MMSTKEKAQRQLHEWFREELRRRLNDLLFKSDYEKVEIELEKEYHEHLARINQIFN